MSIFTKLWLILLIMLVIIVFMITAGFIQSMVENMVNTHKLNKLKSKMIDDVNAIDVNEQVDLDAASEFINSHTDEELLDNWNTFFDGNPPFELDIKELREQAEDFVEKKDK